jgi:hypothetical protein
MMDSRKSSFVLINVTGGIAVLGSYALWLGNPSNDAGALWGSIAGPGRTLYTVSMLLAAAGYFAFATYVLRLDPERPAFAWITTLFTLILFPSALWMPLTCEYLDTPGPALWWAMRATLAVVGLASLGLVVALRRLARTDGGHARLAVAGAAAFTFQTLVLDALVWPLCFAR